MSTPLLAAVILYAQAACVQPLMTSFELLPVWAALGEVPMQAEFDRPFAVRGDQVLMMDVFRPVDQDAPTPAVVLVHGGFWLYGERWYMHDWAADLVGQGYADISIDYRLLCHGGQYPAPVADVLAAVTHVRDHAAELNVDPQRVALFGVSAGAHLALLAGLAEDASVFDPAWPPGESAHVRAVVEIYGPADFTVATETAEPWQESLVTLFLGNGQNDLPARWREASPVTHVRPDGPPVLILHGRLDPIVPISQAEALRAALQTAGQVHRYIEVPDAGHFWGSVWASPPVQRHRMDILQFLGEHL